MTSLKEEKCKKVYIIKSIIYNIKEVKKMNDREAVLCKIVDTLGSTPRKAGSEMVVFRDGASEGSVGGGALEKVCLERVINIFDTKKGYTEHFNLGEGKPDGLGMICGGEATISFTYISDYNSVKKSKERALIFGGGHVGKEVVSVLEHVGFSVWVLDNRPEFASPERHPKAEKCIICDYSDIARDVTITDNDYIVILTHGHLNDREVLLQACKTNAAYVGCIGSKHKVITTFDYLRQNGVSEEKIKEIHAPIGFDLLSDTPEEISISIAAEIIRCRALKNLEKGVGKIGFVHETSL